MGSILDTLNIFGLTLASLGMFYNDEPSIKTVGILSFIIFDILFIFFSARTIITKGEKKIFPEDAFNKMLRKLRLGFLI